MNKKELSKEVLIDLEKKRSELNGIDFDIELRYISCLDELGEEDKALDVMSSLVSDENCTFDIKNKYRRMMYERVCNSRISLSDQEISRIEILLDYNKSNNGKYDIKFIKYAIKYLKDKSSVDYKRILKFLNFYDVSILNREQYNDNDYSDFDLYHLTRFKCYKELRMFPNIINEYEEAKQLIFFSKKVPYFLKYYYAYALYRTRDYCNAVIVKNELLEVADDDYVISLPVKYKDCVNFDDSILTIIRMIINRISLKKNYLRVYIYRFYEYSTKLDEKIFATAVKESNNQVNIIDYKEFDRVVLKDLIDFSQENLQEGRIIKIYKNGGFISNKETKESIYFRKQFLGNKKIDDEVEFIEIPSFDKKKKKSSTEAIVRGRL